MRCPLYDAPKKLHTVKFSAARVRQDLVLEIIRRLEVLATILKLNLFSNQYFVIEKHADVALSFHISVSC